MAKLNQIEVNGTTYDLQDKSIFTGTKSEVDSAISNGTIKEGDIVNITDDVSGNGGGGPVLDTMEEIMANTESGIGAGALAVKEGFNQVNSSLGGLSFSIVNGEPYVKVGADTPRPFKSGDIELVKTIPIKNDKTSTYTIVEDYDFLIIDVAGDISHVIYFYLNGEHSTYLNSRGSNGGTECTTTSYIKHVKAGTGIFTLSGSTSKNRTFNGCICCFNFK